jgi:hypothetical protein
VPEKFVDDTNLLYCDYIYNIDSTVSAIEGELCKVNQWVDVNSLALNTSKTKMLVIAPPKMIKGLGTIHIKLNNVLIQQCNSLKCLGLTLDSTLDWSIHINNISKVCHSRIRSLYKIQNYVPLQYKLILAHALVLSLINYMSTIWSSTTNHNLNIIERVIRCLARFVSGTRKYDRISPIICNEFKWLFPSELCSYNMMVLMFKLQHGVPIMFFDNYTKLRNETHKYPTKSASNLNCTLLPRTSYGYSTFYFRAIKCWNELPSNIKESTSLYVFKANLKKHYLNLQKQRLNV